MPRKKEEIALNPYGMIMRKLDEIHLDIQLLKRQVNQTPHIDLKARIYKYILDYWDIHKKDISYSKISITFGKQTKKLGGIAPLLESLQNDNLIDIFLSKHGGHTCAPIGHASEISTPLSKKEIANELASSIEADLALIRKEHENENPTNNS